VNCAAKNTAKKCASSFADSIHAAARKKPRTCLREPTAFPSIYGDVAAL
jgi:hypothetical protein